jgi:cytochrome c oxidase subunit IV
MDATHDIAVQALPVNKEKVRKLVRIAIILGIITSIEFFLAVAMPKGILLYAVFIGLTLVKAYYIVSEFMHLKYEVKILIWSILIPIIFVIWLIIAMFTEGGSVFHLKGY